MIINELITLVEDVNINEIPEDENPKKVANLLQKAFILMSNKKVKEFKILTSKQMLQRLPIALAQVKADNTSENLLNEIRQIMYFFV